MIHASLREVPIAEIDLEFDLFSISWPAESEPLTASIARAGVIQPPLLIDRGGRLKAVCGVRRIRAAAKLGLPVVPALSAGECAVADSDLLALNVEDNLSQRALTLLERARFVALADRLGRAAGDRILARFAAAVGAPPDDRELRSLRALDAAPQSVKELVHLRGLPARTAFHLAAQKGADAELLASLAREAGLTVSQTGELAEMAREIMLRDGLTCAELCAAIRPHCETTREDLVARLRALRFPEWRRRSEAMRRALNAVNGVKGILVRPPPCFEGDELRAEIVFRTPAELAERVRTLDRFAAGPAADEACRLL